MDALAAGRVNQAQIPEKERALLDYVQVLTLEPAKVRDTHVERLRKSGWTDEQIFEAAFITSLFAFFNRMADAYGLDYPPNGWLPEELRPASAAPDGTQKQGRPAEKRGTASPTPGSSTSNPTSR